MFRGERAKYKKHQVKAQKTPEKYLSLIIDGMDQAKTGLPHFLTRSKVLILEFVYMSKNIKEKIFHILYITHLSNLLYS